MGELIRLRPDDAEAYYHRGQAYVELDALDQSYRRIFAKPSVSTPTTPTPTACGAIASGIRVSTTGAIADFDMALRLDPENAAAHLGRGGAYRMKGDLTQAIADYDASVLLNPKAPRGYRFRADAHVATEDYDLAVADCNMTLQLSPRDSIAHFTRGNAHLHNGKLNLALADFNTAVEIEPHQRPFHLWARPGPVAAGR